MSFFHDKQALACYLIPSSISALVIKISTLQDRDKVLATLCRRLCKKPEQDVRFWLFMLCILLKFITAQIGYVAKRCK